MSGKVICFNSSSNYTTGLTGAQSNPVNPGWGRKGSAGVGRTSSPGAQDGQQRLLPCLACGTGHCRRASRAPPSLPVCSQETHPLCLGEGVGCQRAAQHLGLWLSAWAAFKGASQAWVTPGEITRFMHSRERQ